MVAAVSKRHDCGALLEIVVLRSEDVHENGCEDHHFEGDNHIRDCNGEVLVCEVRCRLQVA